MNSGKMEQIQVNNILNVVSKYYKTHGVTEETTKIPIDLSLMDIEFSKLYEDQICTIYAQLC